MYQYIHDLPSFAGPAASPYVPPRYPFGVKAKAECRSVEFELYGSAPGQQKSRLSYHTYAVLADVSLRSQTLYPTVWGVLTELFPHLGWEKIRHIISPPDPREQGIYLDDAGQPLERADFVVVIGKEMYAVNPTPDHQKFSNYVFTRRTGPNHPRLNQANARTACTSGHPAFPGDLLNIDPWKR